MQMSKGIQERIRGKFARYEMEVGILTDGIHRLPRRGARGLKGQDVLSTYAGGPVRKTSRAAGPLTISEVSAANRERLGTNYLTEPFQKASSPIMRFATEFLKLALGKSQKRRVENLLQAIVRNPILRGEYGGNSALTRKIKGFSRSMIDTGQLFKAIKAIVKVRGGRV